MTNTTTTTPDTTTTATFWRHPMQDIGTVDVEREGLGYEHLIQDRVIEFDVLPHPVDGYPVIVADWASLGWQPAQDSQADPVEDDGWCIEVVERAPRIREELDGYCGGCERPTYGCTCPADRI